MILNVVVARTRPSHFVRDITNSRFKLIDQKHKQELHIINGSYFVASRAIAFDHGGWETMIFHASKSGDIINWKEVYAHRGFEDIDVTVRSFYEGMKDDKQDNVD